MTRCSSLNRVGLLAALLLVGVASALHAQTITTFDPDGSTYTNPTAINSAGQITGYYIGGTPGGVHGFLRQADGTLNSFDAPDAYGEPVGTFPTSINSEGQIAGFRYTVGHTQHSFLRQTDGTFILFDLIGSPCPASESRNVVPQLNYSGDGDIPTGINAKGQITGVYGNGSYQSFLRKPNGTIICFGISPSSGARNTQAQAINKRGQITGYYYDSDSVHGFLRKRDGTIIRFDVPDSSTFPAAINGKGQISGYYSNADGSHGFLREANGTLITFDPVTRATAINQAGEITGYYLGADGTYHGFLRKRKGQFETFDAPGACTGNYLGTFPVAIGHGGEITGYYMDANGGVHGFVRDK